MADKRLRGSTLGSQSLADDRGVELAPRQQVTYVTADGVEFDVTLSTEADVPLEWEHPKTGHIGRLLGAEAGEPTEEKPTRTHWDMLRERRSEAELATILSDKLDELRAGEIGPAHLHRPAAKKAPAKDRKSVV